LGFEFNGVRLERHLLTSASEITIEASAANRCAALMTDLLHRWLVEDDGQDLVEYVLLTSVVGLAILLAINALDDVVRVTYESWDGATQALWEPQDPL
jgi:Flp pilus assembly pilin Flp